MPHRLLASQMDSPAGGTVEIPSSSAQRAAERAVLDVVTALVEHNLLRLEHGPDGEPRFSMLETIREYGWEQLTASGERDDVCRSHANFFLRRAEAMERQLQGPRAT